MSLGTKDRLKLRARDTCEKRSCLQPLAFMDSTLASALQHHGILAGRRTTSRRSREAIQVNRIYRMRPSLRHCEGWQCFADDAQHHALLRPRMVELKMHMIAV